MLHLDDLFFNDPSIMTEWDNINRQSTWKEILTDKEKMNSKEEIYYSYDYSLQNKEKDEK